MALNKTKLAIGMKYGMTISRIKEDMETAVMQWLAGTKVVGDDRNAQLQEILNYKTRMDDAITVQALMIWNGRQGRKAATGNGAARQLATTLRTTAHESDMLDTMQDDYDPKVLALKELPEEKQAELEGKSSLYGRITKNLENLVLNRFETLHPAVNGIYRDYRGKVIAGQADDVEMHLAMLRNDTDDILLRFSKPEDTMDVLVRKLGWIGGGAAKIIYREAGGNDRKLEQNLFDFWTLAATQLQYWANDVTKLQQDVKNLDTNPIITSAILLDDNPEKIDEKLLLRVLRRQPRLIEELQAPYYRQLQDTLAALKQADFSYSDHARIFDLVNIARTEGKNYIRKTFGI